MLLHQMLILIYIHKLLVLERLFYLCENICVILTLTYTNEVHGHFFVQATPNLDQTKWKDAQFLFLLFCFIAILQCFLRWNISEQGIPLNYIYILDPANLIWIMFTYLAYSMVQHSIMEFKFWKVICHTATCSTMTK